MFYLTTHSTHFMYGYMASDIWLRTILIVRKETLCRHIGYSYRLTARVLLYAPSHIQDNTYHGLCYTSRGALAVTRNSSMGLLMKFLKRKCMVSESNLPHRYLNILQSKQNKKRTKITKDCRQCIIHFLTSDSITNNKQKDCNAQRTHLDI